jgi:hypothetical protein
MKKSFWMALSTLAAAALACAPIQINVPSITPGPTDTLEVNEPLPEDGSVAAVEINMGAGELRLAPGAEGLMEGVITYNVGDWKPTLTYQDDRLVIEQGDAGSVGFLAGKLINRWDLKLGDVPMDLTIHAGAYQGELALGGLPLRSLTINDGASDSEVTFNSPNPEAMDSFRYSSGASSTTLTGLANANFAEMQFDGGAGEYTLDFSGELQRDARVTIHGGVGSITVIIPSETAATVNVESGVGSVDQDGAWTVKDGVYTTGGSGPVLTIEVTLGVGSLTLVSK